jgi:hypothetical protein
MSRLSFFVGALLLTAACPSAAQTPTAKGPAPASQPVALPTSEPGTASQPAADPFARLTVLVPPAQLPPIRSVRLRDKREEEDRSRKATIRVSINSKPKGVAVYYGGKLLGTTPLTLTAHKGSTPMDVVLRSKGYMTLRTRVRRKENRGYFFKLTPAKFR